MAQEGKFQGSISLNRLLWRRPVPEGRWARHASLQAPFLGRINEFQSTQCNLYMRILGNKSCGTAHKTSSTQTLWQVHQYKVPQGSVKQFWICGQDSTDIKYVRLSYMEMCAKYIWKFSFSVMTKPQKIQGMHNVGMFCWNLISNNFQDNFSQYLFFAWFPPCSNTSVYMLSYRNCDARSMSI